MRLAIFSDVHGNPIALDAVLADIRARGGVDGYWVLGDLVAMGFDPAAVLRTLAVLPNARFVRGNTDRYVLTGQGATGRGPLTIADAQANPDLVPTLVSISQGLAWTYGYLAATGWIDWLATLPLDQRLILPDGTRLLGVHAAPGRDDGANVEPKTSDEELARLVEGCDADLVCVGHSHQALDRQIGGVRVVNVGCVSNPNPANPSAAEPRATYVLLEADAEGYQLTFHHVAYDVAAVVRAICAHHVFPNPEWLVARFVDPTSDLATGLTASPRT